MTIVKFEGIVTEKPDGYFIGEVNVIFAVEQFSFNNPVTVALADERFKGDLYIESESCAYSEWTPGDPAHFEIEEHDILRRLDKYLGKRVVLWVADEPINTLDPPPFQE